MKRLIRTSVLCLGLAALSGTANASALEDGVVEQLKAQGFSEVTVSHTLLGRIRIMAVSSEYRREIVINPATGEILRDYLVLIEDDGKASPRVPQLATIGGGSSGGGTSGGGSGGGNDNEDDDEDDDEDDEDDEDDDDHH